jgi:hypothetical protein
MINVGRMILPSGGRLSVIDAFEYNRGGMKLSQLRLGAQRLAKEAKDA